MAFKLEKQRVNYMLQPCVKSWAVPLSYELSIKLGPSVWELVLVAKALAGPSFLSHINAP